MMQTRSKKTLVMSRKDVHDVVEHYGLNSIMDQMIARLDQAIIHFNPAQTEIPIRSGFHYNRPHNGLVEWMPLHKQGTEVMIKVVGYHPHNPEHYRLPTIISTISAYDTATGHLIGLMDGVLLTALRTGAASAVASKYMASADSKVLGLVGCGAQAVSQLHALSRLFDFEEVLVFDSDPKAMASLAARCEPFENNTPMRSTSLEEVVAQSDILCTATSIAVGTGPLFKNAPTRAHVHINAVGSDFPGKIELPRSLLQQSFVCPDFRDQAVIEGECQQLTPDEIDDDLTTVIQNQDAYRHLGQQRTVFDSTGWALEDQVAMDMFFEYGVALGLGQEIEIESMPDDAKSPYHFLMQIPAVL